MADADFEEFHQHLDQMPQHIRAPAKCYTLAHAITPCEDLPNFETLLASFETSMSIKGNSETIQEEDSNAIKVDPPKPPERRRRKLPEIPKIYLQQRQNLIAQAASLADELSRVECTGQQRLPLAAAPLNLALRDHYFRSHFRVDSMSPADSDVWTGTDADSGRDSTVGSPEEYKYSSSRTIKTEEIESSSSLDNLDTTMSTEAATHRGLHKFTARHADEIDIDIGDPVYVHNEAEDSWCEGVNLRTHRKGIFPSAYVVDVDYDFDADGSRVNKERYVLDYLCSVETHLHKGEEVLSSAVQKLRQIPSEKRQHPQSCIIEISDQGIHVMDKSKPDPDRAPLHDYFFALKNVTFCGFHSTETQYMGIITKHPNEERFACHVFQGNGSTRHVAEAIGRAFHRFCRKFIELAYPIHEFYME